MAADAAPPVGRHRGSLPPSAAKRAAGWIRRQLDDGRKRLVDVLAEDVAPAPGPGPVNRSRLARSAWLTYPVMVLGAVVVIASFAMSRAEVSDAHAVFWAGQFALVVPCAVACLRRSISASGRVVSLQLLSAMQSLIAWAYSPDQFRFPDELQHLRTAHDIAASGHLFIANSALPVSPGFPGLEVVTTSLSQLAGISLFAAGVVTVSVAHILLITAVLLLMRAVGLGPRLAAAAALVYGFAPDYAYFDTLFTYTAIALPFFVLALRAAARSLRGRDGALLVLPPLLVAVVAHHLTGYVTCLVIAVLAIVAIRAELANAGRKLFAVAAAGAAAAVAWTLGFAPKALDYLATPTKVAIYGLLSPRPGSAGDAAARGLSAPWWERGIGLGTTALVLGAALLGALTLWRSAAPRALRWLGFGALLYPVALGVRVLAADGPEIATRLLAYLMLFVSVSVAIVLVRVWGDGRHPRGIAASVALASVMAVGATIVGTPPSYERLPGQFHATANESGVDSLVSTSAAFSTKTFPPHSVVACDLVVCSLVSGYANVTATTDAADMFYAKNLTLRHAEITRLRLTYVIIDDRITRTHPDTGIYFAGEGAAANLARPYPANLLEDFWIDPALSLVYDNGQVQIYDATRIWNE
jgi:hypothetical protein